MSIVQKEDPVLRAKAEAVPDSEFGSAKLTQILADMSKALAAETDGVALAAPQIGVSLRIFIVSKRLFDDGAEDAIFINPEIIKTSQKKAILDEGCLSVRWIYGQTTRAEKVTVKALDEYGNSFTWNGAGLMAQIFQHEIDHLNGILFIDHAENLNENKTVTK